MRQIGSTTRLRFLPLMARDGLSSLAKNGRAAITAQFQHRSKRQLHVCLQSAKRRDRHVWIDARGHNLTSETNTRPWETLRIEKIVFL